ncbi:hypothetical protein [Acidovorax sp. T1m]|uniref:hypothetical protein n=1 Tax=Acidovorax sp. T1m TaxID=2006116 RepID=UPI001303616A|nr:hypothetical protein [Acidovorax sp. T1m]
MADEALREAMPVAEGAFMKECHPDAKSRPAFANQAAFQIFTGQGAAFDTA